jgi:hypothetical protein
MSGLVIAAFNDQDDPGLRRRDDRALHNKTPAPGRGRKRAHY